MSKSNTKQSKKNNIQEEYNQFIKQIELDEIRLIHAKVDNLDYSYFPGDASVYNRIKAEYENEEEGFNIFQEFRSKINDTDTNLTKARITVKFHIRYESEIPMTDELFEIFKKRNLLVNTWPYFREFAHTVTQRMGWPPYIAPVYLV